MNKLIPGKEYYVSGLSEKNALDFKVKREFACYDRAGRMYFQTETTSKNLVKYNYAVEIPLMAGVRNE